jgi:hypothetical protein
VTERAVELLHQLLQIVVVEVIETVETVESPQTHQPWTPQPWTYSVLARDSSCASVSAGSSLIQGTSECGFGGSDRVYRVVRDL